MEEVATVESGVGCAESYSLEPLLAIRNRMLAKTHRSRGRETDIRTAQIW